MEDETKKIIYWLGVTALFIYVLIFLPFYFAANDEDGTWFFPLVAMLPAVVVTIILWRIGSPKIETEHLDDSKLEQTRNSIKQLQDAG